MRRHAPRQSSRFGQLRISRQRAPPAHNRSQCRQHSLRHQHSRRHSLPRLFNLLSALKYGMGSRKYKGVNRWKRARKGLLHKER